VIHAQMLVTEDASKWVLFHGPAWVETGHSTFSEEFPHFDLLSVVSAV